MNIIGPDGLIFGVDNVEDCCKYMTDYGLTPNNVDSSGGVFTAVDGTFVEIRHKDDSSLPAPLHTGASIRKTIYGVADQATLDALKAELSKDRDICENSDGSFDCVDDSGFALAFQITCRNNTEVADQIVNIPGAKANRGLNVIGAIKDHAPKPQTLSHVVYFVPDAEKAEAFYRDRLGFRVVDRMNPLGPFMRPQGTMDHHTLFMIQTPPFMQGVEHFTFHMLNPSDMLQAGKRFQDMGYETFWGPGRHIMGSNWFWYFNSPLGVHVEYDADMDLHDDSWEARECMASEDNSQIYNFTLAANFQPGGGPH